MADRALGNPLGNPLGLPRRATPKSDESKTEKFDTSGIFSQKLAERRRERQKYIEVNGPGPYTATPELLELFPPFEHPSMLNTISPLVTGASTSPDGSYALNITGGVGRYLFYGLSSGSSGALWCIDLLNKSQARIILEKNSNYKASTPTFSFFRNINSNLMLYRSTYYWEYSYPDARAQMYTYHIVSTTGTLARSFSWHNRYSSSGTNTYSTAIREVRADSTHLYLRADAPNQTYGLPASSYTQMYYKYGLTTSDSSAGTTAVPAGWKDAVVVNTVNSGLASSTVQKITRRKNLDPFDSQGSSPDYEQCLFYRSEGKILATFRKYANEALTSQIAIDISDALPMTESASLPVVSRYEPSIDAWMCWVNRSGAHISFAINRSGLEIFSASNTAPYMFSPYLYLIQSGRWGEMNFLTGIGKESPYTATDIKYRRDCLYYNFSSYLPSDCVGLSAGRPLNFINTPPTITPFLGPESLKDLIYG